MGSAFYLALLGDILLVCVLALLLVSRTRQAGDRAREAQELRQALDSFLRDNAHSSAQAVQDSVTNLGTLLGENQRQAGAVQAERLDAIDKNLTAKQQAMNEAVAQQLRQMEERLRTQEHSSEEKLEAMRRTISDSLGQMRTDNAKKLDEIRTAVDEQLQENLQKRISESFRTVSQQLEQVYKGLGEMQTLAGDVGGLKQVLSGVKTRGILGEIQLGAILEEILAPEQYDENVATVPGSSERVEFAVRLPGTDDRPVYLPIDSKFPGDAFAHLQSAQLAGDPAAVKVAQRELEQVLKKCAKDIRDKYVETPYTTNFGIMFLPFEGLYAEVVNSGLLETLQRDYSVNVAGPSTMAALLNSLQMGFRTLAIQKRSSEVWSVLGAVKTEFGKFNDVLLSMQKHLNATGEDLNKLMSTRTRAINRKLSDVQRLDGAEAARVLALSDEPGESAGTPAEDGADASDES